MNIAVIGACNVDVSARSYSKYSPKDSNPSKITVTYGGVGRNVAHNLCLLGQKVSFFTVFGGDAYGKAIEEDCRALGMDLSHAIRTNEQSSMYLCINNEQGDLEAGASDMALVRHITREYVEENVAALNRFDAVVFDTNLDVETVSCILECCTAPLFLDTVSKKKAAKLLDLPFLKRKLEVFKANRYEAEVLFGRRIACKKDACEAARALGGVFGKKVYITLGEEGVCFFDGEKCAVLPPYACEIASSMGAGDAFLSGLILGFSLGKNAEDCARLGLAASRFALGCEEAVNRLVTAEKLIEFTQTEALYE